MNDHQRERRRVAQLTRRRMMSVTARNNQLAQRRQQLMDTQPILNEDLQPNATLNGQQSTNQGGSTSSRGRRPSRRRIRPHNYGRNFVQPADFEKLILPEPTICQFCGAKLLLHETTEICCSKGSVYFPRPMAPQEIIDLFLDEGEDGEHFRRNIRSYNNAFAFTSMGANIDQNLASGRDGVFTYRAQGSVYHRIGSLLPIDGARPRYLQMYIYGIEHEIENRRRDNDIIRPDIILRLKQILDTYNSFVHAFRQFGQRNDIQNCRLIIKELTLNRRVHELPTTSQVAALIIGGDNGLQLQPRDIIVQSQSGELRRVANTAGYYDPLQYPLLLPYGHHGWDLNIHSSGRRSISCRSYYSKFYMYFPLVKKKVVVHF